jgi:hypothetical protein
MKVSTLIALIIVLLSFNLNAQTTITGVVTDSLNNPLPFASVFLSQTTYGVVTDNTGAYTLNILKDGIYEMLISCIGYKTYSQFIKAEGNKQNINIRLLLNLYHLKEISVTAREKNRLANYTQFLKLFLGETPNSESCKILNPEDLHLYKDSESNALNAFSVKPLKIENKALGYYVIYNLKDFYFNPETGFLRYEGDHYFQQLPATSRESKRWTRNRLAAYYGSRMHFFRAIFSDSLAFENYKLFECAFDSSTHEIITVKPLFKKDLCVSESGNYTTVFFKNPVMLSYTDNHPELATGLTGFQPQNVLSTLTFSDIINVYPNGYFDNPYSITWGGELANERVADMLPYDFLPNARNNAEPDEKINSSPIDEYLLSVRKTRSRDQVFLHTDRNMYSPGDTIRFQAYVRDRFTSSFGSESASLYALLFNEEYRLTDSARFKIYRATSSGWMTIPSNAETGKYHLSAFTGMMQNYDPSEAFQLDLFVKERGSWLENIHVEFDKELYHPGDTVEAKVQINDHEGKPVHQNFKCILTKSNSTFETSDYHTNKNGTGMIEYILPDTVTWQPGLQIKTQYDNDRSEIIHFNIPFENNYFELKFLPEGGNLIAGIEQRIGFNATGFKGEPLIIKGLLKNATGKILDTIKSGIYGPGIFSCVPESGMYVELMRSGKNEIYPLPEPLKSGICISVYPVDNRSFAVEIQSTSYDGEPVTVSGIMNITQIFSQEVQLNKKQRIVIQTDQLPSGVAQVTIFNKEMKPLAERLFYINADKHLKFSIKSDKQFYNPAETTNLCVLVTDADGKAAEGIFSIAVADSSSGNKADLFIPGIEYTYNYHPGFYGNLPPKVLSRGIENLSDTDRDLMFMVYGWSRYSWKFNEKEIPFNEPVNYDLLNMKILYAMKNNRSDRRLDLISLEGPSLRHLLTNKVGEISVRLDSLPEITRSVTLVPDPKNKKRVQGAMLNIPYNEQYFKSNKLLTPLPAINFNSIANRVANTKISLGSDVIEIPEVVIRGHAENKRIYHDKYEEMFQYTEVSSLDSHLLWSLSSLEVAVRCLAAPYSITNNGVVFRPPRSMTGPSLPALIVLDGMPIQDNGWGSVSTILPSELTSLTILKGGQAYSLYGRIAAGGVIFVNTRSSDPSLMKLRTDWKLQHTKDKMLLPISIYRNNKEFYVPTKFDIEKDPSIQQRSTIFWQSEVYFNGKDPVKISFNNLRHAGPVIITINGASFNNLVGTGRSAYVVN